MPRKHPTEAPEVNDLEVEEIVDATIDRTHDLEEPVTSLSDETLAAVTETINSQIKEATGYATGWTVRDGIATFGVHDTGAWRNPLTDILSEDPALADNNDSFIDILARNLHIAAFTLTGPANSDSSDLTTHYNGPTDTEH